MENPPNTRRDGRRDARARKLDELAIAIASRLLHDDDDVDAIVRSRLLTIPRFELHTHTHMR